MIGPLSVQPDLLLATTLGTTSSQTADRIHDVSYGYHFFLRFFICIVFQFLFVWRECLVHQVPIVLTVLSFRFSGLCLMVVIATIHFHGQASPVGVWSFLRLPLTRRAVKKKSFVRCARKKMSYHAFVGPHDADFVKEHAFFGTERNFEAACSRPRRVLPHCWPTALSDIQAWLEARIVAL